MTTPFPPSARHQIATNGQPFATVSLSNDHGIPRWWSAASTVRTTVDGGIQFASGGVESRRATCRRKNPAECDGMLATERLEGHLAGVAPGPLAIHLGGGR